MNKYNLPAKTIKRVLKVWDKLCDFLPPEYKNIQIVFTSSSTPHYNTFEGGYAVSNTICIGIKYLNDHPKDIAIATMLAHEVGHHILGHVNGTVHSTDILPTHERDADHFGLFLCQLAGFTRESFIFQEELFENKRAKSLSAEHIKEHGTGSVRIELLKSQDEYLNNLNETL